MAQLDSASVFGTEGYRFESYWVYWKTLSLRASETDFNADWTAKFAVQLRLSSLC